MCNLSTITVSFCPSEHHSPLTPNVVTHTVSSPFFSPVSIYIFPPYPSSQLLQLPIDDSININNLHLWNNKGLMNNLNGLTLFLVQWTGHFTWTDPWFKSFLKDSTLMGQHFISCSVMFILNLFQWANPAERETVEVEKRRILDYFIVLSQLRFFISNVGSTEGSKVMFYYEYELFSRFLWLYSPLSLPCCSFFLHHLIHSTVCLDMPTLFKFDFV